MTGDDARSGRANLQADGGETACSSKRVIDHPGVETIGAGGGPKGDPEIPCHGCGTEERFSAMKRSDDWTLTYLDNGSGQWVAYCPECDSK